MSDSTWTKQRMFDPATIKKSMTTTRRERLRLLFKPTLYAYEDKTRVKYKKMNGVSYILEVKHYE